MDRQTIKMNGTIWFFVPQNIILDTKIIILCALVQMVRFKTCFLQNDGEQNVPIFGQPTDLSYI